MRRLTSVAAASVVMTTLVSPSARADAVGDRPFLIAQPALAWPCEAQSVYIDVATAPSPWHVEVVRAALVRFRSASGRPWPESSDPSAPIHVRWFDPDNHEGALAVVGADDQFYRGADVQLSPKVRKEWLLSTVLHELGHVGGLAHVSDQDEVMGLYPNAPHGRYAVGDLVGLKLANRGCTDSSPTTAGRLGVRSR